MGADSLSDTGRAPRAGVFRSIRASTISSSSIVKFGPSLNKPAPPTGRVRFFDLKKGGYVEHNALRCTHLWDPDNMQISMYIVIERFKEKLFLQHRLYGDDADIDPYLTYEKRINVALNRHKKLPGDILDLGVIPQPMEEVPPPLTS